MKIIAKKLHKQLVVIQIETLDDLWTLYNLIAVGDFIEGKTSRRVVMTDRPEDKGERKWIYLKVKVEEIEFHEFSNRLRAKGKIMDGPKDLVQLHSYHTFNIEERTKIGIVKENWTQLHFKLLQESAKKKLVQKILVIAIDVGEATFGEIGDYYQKTSISLAHHVPGKRFGDVKDSVNARNAFFSEVMKRMKMMMEGDDYTNIIIAGPGFVREQYMNYCIKKEGGLKSKLITEPITSATKSGLYELLRKDTVQALLHDSRIIEETKLVDEFLTRMGKETGDVVYGFDEVTKANEIGAIDTLMITDEMMRTLNAEKDEKMLQLLKNVENNRGNIVIMSTLHDAGKRIKGFGGLAALLRFKMQY